MAAVDWFAHAEVAEPVAPARRRRPPARRPAAPVRSRRKLTQRRVRGHIVWMTLFAILLFGVVAVNVAVLRAHVAVSKLDQKRLQLQNENQALQSQALGARRAAPDRGGGAPARPHHGVGGQHLLLRPAASTAVEGARRQLAAASSPARHPPHVRGPRCARRLAPDRARVIARRDGADAGEGADRAAGRAGDDLRPAGQPARDRRAGDGRRRRSAADLRSAAGGADRGEGARAQVPDGLPAALRPQPRLRLRQAEGAAEARGQAREAPPRRLHLRARPAARLPAGHRRGPGARVRGPRQHRALGPRVRAEPAAGGEAGKRDRGAGRARPGGEHDPAAPGASGPRRLPHARQPDPGERRAGAHADRAGVACEGRDGDRHGPAHGRDPRHGAGAGLQRERHGVDARTT